MSGILPEHVEPVFVIECSRCANESISYGDYKTDALDDYTAAGWTYDGLYVFCAQCSEVTP